LNAASLLSAVSATIAAILVAANLYLSGRREQNRWARDALVDVFVTFLDAGFSGHSACTRLTRSIRANAEQEISDYRERIARAHQTETEMLTKMRLLTGPAVVEAAMVLHVAIHAYVDSINASVGSLPQREQDAAQDQVWRARRSFLAAAKTEIGLKPKVSSITHDLPTRQSHPA
jgi:cytochrome c556